MTDRAGRAGRRRFASLSFLIGGLFSLLVASVPSAGWLYGVFLLPGIRECFEPARKALQVDLAGRGEHGKMIGFYYFVLGIVNLPASFIGGLLWERDPAAPFYVGGGITLLGFLLMFFFGPYSRTRIRGGAVSPQGTS